MENVFEKYIWEMKKNINELPEEFLNSRCIVTTYFNQYAAGICGTRKYVHAYLDKDGNGWPYDAAAYKAAKDAGIKPYYKKGKDEGYGEVGCEQFTRTVMSVRDAIVYDDLTFGDITKFEPLEEKRH